MLDQASIECMTSEEAVAVLAQVREAIASLPPVKRRKQIKDQTREPDVRTAFEDPYVMERIRLRMQESDLLERINGQCPILR